MPNVYLLSHVTGELEVTKELLDQHVKEALSGEIKIVDVKNLNFLNPEGQWEEIAGKDGVEEEEEPPVYFKLGAKRIVDPSLLWAFCKQ